MNRRSFLQLSALFCALTCSAQTMVPWLTRSYDNQRSNWNPHETQLTQASVAKGLYLRTKIPIAGDRRGMEAQPLILPNVTTPKGVKDVMVLPSLANVVRGVDAHDGSAIWQVTLGNPVQATRQIDMWGNQDKLGCMSTGVIDPDLKEDFQVCWVSPDGTPQAGRWYMFVLNVGDGSQVTAPVMLTGGTPDFNSQMRKQRSALLETNVNGVKTVFACSGTIFETITGSAGYCLAFDVATNQFTAILPTTKGNGGGVWAGGQGPSADAEGYLYIGVGNGNFNGVDEWGESFLKLRYRPGIPTSFSQITAQGTIPLSNSITPASLAVIDNWTSWTDNARTGNAPKITPLIAGDNPPSGGRMAMNVMAGAKLIATVTAQGAPAVLVYPKMAQGAWADQDWNSAGAACVFQIGICYAGGKDGILYPIHSLHMGQTRPADLLNPHKNCTKLAGPPMWATMSPGEVDPCPTDTRTLNFLPGGDTAHLHMTPVQMYDPLLKSWVLFVWGENQQLHKWKVGADGSMVWVANGHEYASGDVRGNPPGGMPGGFCSGASNGGDANSAILVCTVPRGDSNKYVVRGDIIVYDPVHLGPDGFLKVLWSSAWWNWNFSHNKFNVPVIDGGQIYVSDYDGSELVLGVNPQ